MTDDLTARLAEWEALAQAATEGPWKANGPGEDWAVISSGADSVLHSYLTHEKSCEVCEACDCGDEGAQIAISIEDAELIAASRTALPALIAAVQAVLAILDEDHCPGGCDHDAIDAEALGGRIKHALMEQIGDHQ